MDDKKRDRIIELRPRKFSLQEEPQWRREARRVSIHPENETIDEEDADSEADADKSINNSRKKKFKKSSSLDQKHSYNRSSEEFKAPDQKPHSHYVQLQELKEVEDSKEWRQIARWIKYEEDLEEVSGRWGKPHVATLSFHAVLDLRKCLESGIFLFDLSEKDLAGLAFRIAEEMENNEVIEEHNKPAMMRHLLLPHRSVGNNERRFSVSWRKNSIYNSLQLLKGWDKSKGRRSTMATILRPTSSFGSGSIRHHHSGSLSNDQYKSELKTKRFETSAESIGSSIDDSVKIDLKDEKQISSNDLSKLPQDSIAKRIPKGADATIVFFGNIDFIKAPTIVFIRMVQNVALPVITEMSIPVKFLILLIGPNNFIFDYREVGRSISTLMSTQSFNKLSRKAKNKKELLGGINEFLGDSIILPPGKWDDKELLPFEELQSKASKILERKKEIVIEKQPVESSSKLETISFQDDIDEIKEVKSKRDPLKRIGKPFGGLINDIRARFPFYKSDFTEGVNGQCLAAAIFMYFASLTSAITFGGLIANKTSNLIGISETLISTSITGILFALLSGQPMMVVGTTGPLLLFDESLYKLCQSNEIDYLTFRLYLSIWLAIISLIVACFEGSVLVKKITRFTEDIFSSMISIIFIAESVSKIIVVFSIHPMLRSYCLECITSFVGIDTYNNTGLSVEFDNNTLLLSNNTEIKTESVIKLDVKPNTALFSTFLTLGTFILAYFLRIFKTSKFFGRDARRMLGDFGVPISIITMVIIDYFVDETYTEKLNVPEGLKPSSNERGWIIPLTGKNGDQFYIQLVLLAAIPALMTYIIIFLETHIAELIADKPERKLRKGSGFHMDIVLICFLNILCGTIGAPFVCVATVRSIAHVCALTIMSRNHAPGEKPFIVEVLEQRLSGLLVSTLVGFSVLIAGLLQLVPTSVLFGVFLYMGITSINGIQLFDRLILFFKPAKHHPPVKYVKKVPTARMHLFTLIQVLCLVALWMVKSSKASLIFPFLLAMMIPLRYFLSYLFTTEELEALDSK